MLGLFARSLLSLGAPPSNMLQSRDNRSQFTAATTPYGAMVIDPLPSLQRNGLIVVSTLSLLSLFCSFGLVSFITYRLVFWKKYYRRYIGYNQYVILIYNLAIADFLQGLAFIISLRWIDLNALYAEEAACFLQGTLLQIGDPMSGLFVLAIALHTFMHVTLGRQIGYRTFVTIIVSLWIFGIVMVVIPIGVVGRYVWVPSVAWCWMSIEHPDLRLWTHYIWIFSAQFFTIVLYTIMFVQLRRRISESAILGSRHMESLQRMNRVVAYMVIYPIMYIILSLPLAAGRMASVNHHTPSVVYFCVAGALMTLSGFCDALLYTLTRRNVVLEPEARGNSDNGYKKFASSAKNKSQTPLSLGADGKGPVISTVSALHHRSDSTDAIVPKDAAMEMGVYQHTTIEVTHEPAYPENQSESSADGYTANKRTFFRH